MKKLLPLVWLALTTGFVILMNMSLGKLPPMGKVLDPFQGFWQNGEETLNETEILKLEGLKAAGSIGYDERQVPHIYAENQHDLYFLQGYATARHRLWQMELQTYAAAGRLSEFFGERALDADKRYRRLGLAYGAENALEAIDKDPEVKGVIEAYTEGVNAYINELNYKKLPVEYKILNYEPEAWTTHKTLLLLKYMAFKLTSYSQDLENTYGHQMHGREFMAKWFPAMTDSLDPIIPKDVVHNFNVVQIDTPKGYNPPYPDPAKLIYPEEVDPMKGSNNWAVSAAKTATGGPILCNDPHLGLNLPSIWYEVQLSGPDVDVYGVSLPGSPAVIIGYNEDVAWGVTNASRDVFDLYRITFNENHQYYYDGQWVEPEIRVEEIKVKGAETVYDTVYYTVHGPVVYDDSWHQDDYPVNIALEWTAHDPSNELRTFLQLNQAENYNDYVQALQYFHCPGQNFVFASNGGDIAIWQQGKFPVKWPDQGRFLLDGANPQHRWQSFIPYRQNPNVRNPLRGFVSSANQHPVGPNYPYATYGSYEYYRNRIINLRLAKMKLATAKDMMELQQDASNLYAMETLPMLLELTEGAELSGKSAEIRELLATGWERENKFEETAPSYFEAWDEAFTEAFWQDVKKPLIELQDGTPEYLAKSEKVKKPKPFVVSQMMMNEVFVDSALRDSAWAERFASFQEYALTGLKEAADKISHWEDSTGQSYTWQYYKATSVRHLVPAFDGFSMTNIPSPGNYNCVNAMNSRWGPSWRMIVELGQSPKAYGIYPGGQDGNPLGSHYFEMIDDWAAGEYYELEFVPKTQKANHKFTNTLTITPK